MFLSSRRVLFSLVQFLELSPRLVFFVSLQFSLSLSHSRQSPFGPEYTDSWYHQRHNRQQSTHERSLATSSLLLLSCLRLLLLMLLFVQVVFNFFLSLILMPFLSCLHCLSSLHRLQLQSQLLLVFYFRKKDTSSFPPSLFHLHVAKE